MPAIFIGTLLSFVGLFCGVGTGVIVKIISSEVSLVTTLWYRFLLSLPFLFFAAFWQRGRAAYQIKAKGVLIIRIVLGLCGITLWFTSMRHLPLGLATALMLSSAIYVALASPFLLQEKVGPYRWTAIIGGLAGVFVISNAFSASFEPLIIVPICASLASAGLQITLRKLGKSDAPSSVASWYNFAGFLLTTCYIFLFDEFVLIAGLSLWGYMLALGALGALLQLSFTASYAYVDAVIVSTLRYLQVPLAALVGFVYFAEVPTMFQMLGAVMIVSSSIVIVIREFQKRSAGA